MSRGRPIRPLATLVAMSLAALILRARTAVKSVLLPLPLLSAACLSAGLPWFITGSQGMAAPALSWLRSGDPLT